MVYDAKGRGAAVLVLADGTVFEGTSFGARGEFIGETVFNTSMAGYQEILTDPSYAGQMVTMTYPLIGNYGVNEEDVESDRVYMGGFLVRECSRIRSNWRSTADLDGYLAGQGVVGIEGLDSRALTMHLRSRGAMQGALSSVDVKPESLLEKIERAPGLVGQDLVRGVTVSEPYVWDESPGDGSGFHVVAYDFGIKRNILRLLAAAGCRVTVVPATTAADDVLAMEPDGVFLSNGPGDPEPITYAIEAVRGLLGTKPVFGICLGHQILGLALGGKTYKLKFGHRGGNQPVMDRDTGVVAITAQNHGFAVEPDSLADCGYGKVELTHYNLNDDTLEGLRCAEVGAFSVQYHPEASPGPHDARYLFARFLELMEKRR